jgi:hypothetical protein
MALARQKDQTDTTGSDDIGNNFEVGQYFDYYTVTTFGGQQIDAKVPVLALFDMEGTSGNPDEFKYVD